MAEQLHIPPRTFLGDVLGAVIRNIVTAVDRLNSGPTVSSEPLSPNVPPRPPLAITPQRMDVITVPTRILFQSVEIRHAPQLLLHELFVTSLRRPDRRFPSECHVRDDLPRGQSMHPITHLDVQHRLLDTLLWFNLSSFVHVFLSQPQDTPLGQGWGRGAG